MTPWKPSGLRLLKSLPVSLGMKIIFLNTWGGRAGKAGVLAFFEKHKHDIDVFCLQEIWSSTYDELEGIAAGSLAIRNADIMTAGLQEISDILTDHTAYFAPHYKDHYGLLMLVKKTLKVKAMGDIFVHLYKDFEPKGDIGHHARNVQYVTIDQDGMPVTVMNFHGLWNGQGKGDSPERLLQSQKLLEVISGLKGEIVLGGDFNVTPRTESLSMLSRSGLRELISEFGIPSTRTSFYTKPEKFADYAFVSRGLTVKNFAVLPDEVSDHTPLFLEIG